MKPHSKVKAPKDGLVATALSSSYRETPRTVRWRPPGAAATEAHVGHVYEDTSTPPKQFVVDAGDELEWKVWEIEAVTLLEDDNTPKAKE